MARNCNWVISLVNWANRKAHSVLASVPELCHLSMCVCVCVHSLAINACRTKPLKWLNHRPANRPAHYAMRIYGNCWRNNYGNRYGVPLSLHGCNARIVIRHWAAPPCSTGTGNNAPISELKLRYHRWERRGGGGGGCGGWGSGGAIALSFSYA